MLAARDVRRVSLAIAGIALVGIALAGPASRLVALVGAGDWVKSQHVV